MDRKIFIEPLLFFFVSLILVSCGIGDKELEVPADNLPTYSGDQAIVVREETVIELLSVKSDLLEAIQETRQSSDFGYFISELRSLRPRLEYIRMRTEMLPESERMVIRGNLAVATNQLEKELSDLMAQQPGNDDLAVEIANLKSQLSPIPLADLASSQSPGN